MTKTNTTHQGTIQQFTSSNLTPKLAKQRAVPLLNSEKLLQDVQRLSPEDRTKFVDKVDNVCLLVVPFESSPHFFFKGFSDSRLSRCEIRNRLGERV